MAIDKDDKDKFVKVHQPQFWDLFVRPVYRGIALEVLAWVVFHTWGKRDWQKGENRRYTEEPISPSIIARDIGRPRENVSRAIAKLRADCVLIQDESGCEGINKKRLRELAERDAHVTFEEAVTPASRDVDVTVSATDRDAHVTPTVMSTSRPRDAHVTVDPRKANPEKQLRAPQTIQTIQTKKRGAPKKRAPAHPHFQEFVGWWKQTWSEHNNGKAYVWTDLDGTHLKRLLGAIGFDDLQARAAYAFENAGKPGPLSWFEPPFTFQEFASSKVINKCSATSEGSAGYVEAHTLIEQEQ